MPVSRRKLFSLRATVAYAVFAAAWILLSDRVLAQFSDAQTLARFSLLKGLAFVAATSAMLWVTLQNAPADTDTTLPEDVSPNAPRFVLAWGLGMPLLATAIQWTFWAHLQPYAWLLPYPAVFLAAWRGGWMAGMLATAVSAGLAWFVFLPPHWSWAVHNPSDTLAMGVFATMGLLISLGVEWLHRSEQRSGNSKFEALVEQTLAGIYIIQGDRFLYVNPAFARILGHDSPQHIVQNVRVSELVAEVDRDRVREQLQGRFDNPGREVRYGFTARRRDGSEVALEVHGRGLRTTHGNVVIGLALDVTEQRRNETALRDKQALLDRMSMLAKVGGWGVDVATGMGTRTDGAARILDLDPQDPASLTFHNDLRYFQGEHLDRLRHALSQAIKRGEPYALELQLTSAKGTVKWIRTQGEPVYREGRVVRIEGAIQDITEVQQARAALQAHQEHLEQTVRERTAELEAARQEAERLSRIKSEFLANMSHEIRTPLNGVLGLAQIGMREQSATARQVFEQINTSGRLLLGIINDILDFSKIEAGKLHIELQPMALREVIDRAVAVVRERADSKNLPIHVALADGLPATCMGDALRLEQILLNLLSNAVKFTAQGEVCVGACLRDTRLVLSIADTGIGMRPSQLERLFQPFEQADTSTTRQYGGTGLGLTITKRLVEMLGGDIHAHSEPGQGTRFEVRLPFVPDGPSPTHAAAPTPAAARPKRLTGLRVLAAEDNLVNQMVLRELLTHEGAEVTMSDSGLAVVAELQASGSAAFDLVLMDIQMPLMDGHEATRLIKAFAPNLPVIGQTAHAMAEEHHKCMAAGMVDLVVKPIELETLVRTLLRHAPAAAA